MRKKSLARIPPDEGTLHHHLDGVNYLSFLLKHYELNRNPSPIGRGCEYINGKCRPVWYATPAMADVLQPLQHALSDYDDGDGTDGEYGDNSDDCDTDSEWYKKLSN